MRKLLLGLIGLLFAVPAVATDSGPISSVTVTGLVAQNGTPTPNAPVDIVSNNGVVKVSKNLFDPTKVLFGYYRDRTTGIKQTSNTNFMSSDDGYIPCLPNTTYTFVGTNKTDGTYSKYNTIYFFDSAKNYLGASPYEISQPTTGTTPNNCYYLQVRSNPLDSSSTPIQDAFARFNWQLEQGSTATTYRPYGQIYTDGTVETIGDSANHTATVATLLGVGDYRDTQNINTGAITRNVGVKVLDGTETITASIRPNVFLYDDLPRKVTRELSLCSHYTYTAAGTADMANNTFGVSDSSARIYFKDERYATVPEFQAFLAAQYAAGTPVIVIYPLATETTESVAGQTMTTAPVNNRAGGVAGMTITTLLSSGASVVTTIAADAIKIATTAYNSARFSPVVTELNTTIATIRSVVTNTINQTAAIADLQATKQTRPDETCPAGKKCLLVEDNDGTPHWFEIVESAD